MRLPPPLQATPKPDPEAQGQVAGAKRIPFSDVYAKPRSKLFFDREYTAKVGRGGRRWVGCGGRAESFDRARCPRPGQGRTLPWSVQHSPDSFCRPAAHAPLCVLPLLGAAGQDVPGLHDAGARRRPAGALLLLLGQPGHVHGHGEGGGGVLVCGGWGGGSLGPAGGHRASQVPTPALSTHTWWGCDSLTILPLCLPGPSPAQYFITGCLGITLSYHRMLSHKSFTAPKWLEYTLAYCGVLSVEGDPIEW